MADAYRFLPWTRRGLVAEVEAVDDGTTPLPARARVGVALTVSNLGEHQINLELIGPGDVLGVDPRLIVRTDPARGSTDAEPNYCAAIEFDPPDFPWLFTPARPDGSEQLKPWCVLVVVDLEVVAAPTLPRGAPLPIVIVPREAVATELPDLAESWAWAHAQLLTEATAPAALAGELAERPERNVSRLVCPRRLVAGRRYAACLVPAFEVGRLRGVGNPPDANATLAPAWDANQSSDLVLPVYYHWEFATGPGGDFESLARELRPMQSDPATVGAEPMYLGAAAPDVPGLTLTPADAMTTLDGVLRAPSGRPPALEEIAEAFQTWLRDIVEAPERLRAADDGEARTRALAPPLYAAEHARRYLVPDDAPPWFRALNLDPRARVAAGLGAQVVRTYQEDFMRVCWDQVGDILKANELLSRGRLAFEGLRKLHTRHLAPLDPDRLATVAAPLLDRVRSAGAVARRRIAGSSVPDAAVGAAMRRLTSGQSPILKRLARRTGSRAPARTKMVAMFAAGWSGVDPAGFVPDGILGSVALNAAVPEPMGTSKVSLAAFGLALEVDRDELALLRTSARALTGTRAQNPVLAARSDLGAEGVVTRAALDAALRTDGTVILTRTTGTTSGGPFRVARGGRLGRTTAPVEGLVKAAAAVRRFETARAQTFEVLHVDVATPRAPLVPLELSALAADVRSATDPAVTVPKRIRAMVSVAGQLDLAGMEAIRVPETLDRVMAAPVIETPLYRLLAETDRNRFLPGADGIPPNAITLLETNPRFIEAFLAGANTELNGELLWRRFPSDGRATALRYFWDRIDGRPDIEPIHRWRDNSVLGSHSGVSVGGQLVLLVRGRLLSRYPNAVLYAWRAAAGRLKRNPTGDDLRAPVFTGRLEPDLAFAGFDLTDEEAVAGDGFFFVIQEQPTEPRFGFDEPGPRAIAALPAEWRGATWLDAGTGPGRYLVLDQNPLQGHTAGTAQFGQNAAHQAALMLQQPARVAIHASHLIG